MPTPVTPPTTGPGATASASSDPLVQEFQDAIRDYENQGLLMQGFQDKMKEIDANYEAKCAEIDGDRSIKTKDKPAAKEAARKKAQQDKFLTAALAKDAAQKGDADKLRRTLDLPSKEMLGDDQLFARKDFSREGTDAALDRNLDPASAAAAKAYIEQRRTSPGGWTPEQEAAVQKAALAGDADGVRVAMTSDLPTEEQAKIPQFGLSDEGKAAKTTAKEDSALGQIQEGVKTGGEIVKLGTDTVAAADSAVTAFGKLRDLFTGKKDGEAADSQPTKPEKEKGGLMERIMTALGAVKTFFGGDDQNQANQQAQGTSAAEMLAARAKGELRTAASRETARKADTEAESAMAQADQARAAAEEAGHRTRERKISDLYKTDEKIA